MDSTNSNDVMNHFLKLGSEYHVPYVPYEEYMHQLIREAQDEFNKQVDDYILSLFGGSLEKFKELAPLYILEDHELPPRQADDDPYTLFFERDIRLRPKNHDEL